MPGSIFTIQPIPQDALPNGLWRDDSDQFRGQAFLSSGRLFRFPYYFVAVARTAVWTMIVNSHRAIA